MVRTRIGAAVCLFALTFAMTGCDPGWHVDNPATATKEIDAACVEAGLRAWTPDLTTVPSTDGAAIELVVKATATKPHALHVTWRKKTPNQLYLSVYALGTKAPPGVVDGYRSVRDQVLAHVGEACGATMTLGPESCQRCD